MINILDKPLYIAAVQYKGDENSFEILRDHVVKNGFNADQLNHLFKRGFQGEYSEETHGEQLDEYLAEAHENGVAVIVYFCLHELFESDFAAHPDWVQYKKSGEPIDIYSTHYLGCPNSSWHEYSCKRIAQLCKHDIDGIFLDGPVFGVNGCYCPSCKKRFKDATGRDLEDASLPEFLHYRVEWLTELVRDIRAAADGVKKNVPIYLNNSALRADITGSNTRKLAPYVDMIGAEGGFLPALGESRYITGAMAKEIETKAEGKPTVIFTAADRKPYSFSLHTPQDTVRMLAQSVANGANVWYGLHGPAALMQSESGKAAVEFINRVKAHERYYAGTQSVANAALVWSVETANYYSSKIFASDFTGDGTAMGESEDKGDHFEEFFGWCDVLSQMHISFDVTDEDAFIKSKDKYECIVLPAVACMSQKFADALKEFVRGGGHVVSSLLCGELDERGNARGEGALDSAFGVKLGKPHKCFAGTSYHRVAGEKLPKIYPPLNRFVTLAGGRALATKFKTMLGRYEDFPEEECPSVVENALGKGTFCMIASDIGRDYNLTRSEDEYAVMAKALDCVKSRVITNAPRGVEITVRKKGDEYMLHLINLTGDRSPMTYVPPLYDIKLGLRGKKIIKAHTVDGKALAHDGEHAVLPKLGQYECVVLECK